MLVFCLTVMLHSSVHILLNYIWWHLCPGLSLSRNSCGNSDDDNFCNISNGTHNHSEMLLLTDRKGRLFVEWNKILW